MCFNTSTADWFYALNLDAKQAAAHHRLLESWRVRTPHRDPKGPAAEEEDEKEASPTGQPVAFRQSRPPSPLQTQPSDAPEGPSPAKRRRVPAPKKGRPFGSSLPLKAKTIRRLTKQPRKQTLFFFYLFL